MEIHSRETKWPTFISDENWRPKIQYAGAVLFSIISSASLSTGSTLVLSQVTSNDNNPGSTLQQFGRITLYRLNVITKNYGLIVYKCLLFLFRLIFDFMDGGQIQGQGLGFTKQESTSELPINSSLSTLYFTIHFFFSDGLSLLYSSGFSETYYVDQAHLQLLVIFCLPSAVIKGIYHQA